jgi:hypothetical protein
LEKKVWNILRSCLRDSKRDTHLVVTLFRDLKKIVSIKSTSF